MNSVQKTIPESNHCISDFLGNKERVRQSKHCGEATGIKDYAEYAHYSPYSTSQCLFESKTTVPTEFYGTKKKGSDMKHS